VPILFTVSHNFVVKVDFLLRFQVHCLKSCSAGNQIQHSQELPGLQTATVHDWTFLNPVSRGSRSSLKNDSLWIAEGSLLHEIIPRIPWTSLTLPILQMKLNITSIVVVLLMTIFLAMVTQISNFKIMGIEKVYIFSKTIFLRFAL